MEAARTGKSPANIRAERNALYERLVTVVRNETKDWVLKESKESSDETGKHSH